MLRFRASAAIAVALIAVWAAVALFVFLDTDDAPPASCTAALAEIETVRERSGQEALDLFERFRETYPPGEESTARRIIAIYDEHDDVMRRAIGVCPARTVEAIRSDIDRMAQARSDILRACSAAHWNC